MTGFYVEPKTQKQREHSKTKAEDGMGELRVEGIFFGGAFLLVLFCFLVFRLRKPSLASGSLFGT